MGYHQIIVLALVILIEVAIYIKSMRYSKTFKVCESMRVTKDNNYQTISADERSCVLLHFTELHGQDSMYADTWRCVEH